MGGDLGAAPAGKAPTFLVAALKDPIGANLDRYQIVKGWLDAAGEVQEKVYDVAWSGDRKPGADGKLPPVGNTVDVANATWTNTIGAPELIAVWTDPEFDPAQRAFYYGRVIEIPTPRWTAYDAKYFGVTMPPGSADDRCRSAPTPRRSGTRRELTANSRPPSGHRSPLPLAQSPWPGIRLKSTILGAERAVGARAGAHVARHRRLFLRRGGHRLRLALGRFGECGGHKIPPDRSRQRAAGDLVHRRVVVIADQQRPPPAAGSVR